MFRKFAFFVATIVAVKAYTQNFSCNYYGKKINETQICNTFGFRTKPEAIKAVEDIVSRSGLKQNFYIMECPNIDNCFAAVRDSERLIVYDSNFMQRINNLAKTDWGAMSILAHEIGHHLQGHTLKQGGSDPVKELEADEFSGFVMYQLGATLKEAQMAIMKLTTEFDSGTHPPRSKRIAAIEKGYKNAARLYPTIQKIEIDATNQIEEIEEKPILITKEDIAIDKNKVGCVTGNCQSGYGVAVNKYTFEKYAGNWAEGMRNGKGVEFYKSGERKYEGDFEKGKYNGTGKYYFRNGDRYEGKFKDGEMNGENSTYFYVNGDRLFVNFVNGKKQGKGKIIYTNGQSELVWFKDDKPIR